MHGRGYPRAALADDISADYPPPRPGLLNVGLLHTSAGGRPGHENYAPCRVEALVNHGYDYWALGHVHARETLCRDPWIVFPGNLQGRHVRETGAKGAMLLTVEDGRLREPEFRPLDAVRWASLDLDAAGSPRKPTSSTACARSSAARSSAPTAGRSPSASTSAAPARPTPPSPPPRTGSRPRCGRPPPKPRRTGSSSSG